MVSSSNGKRKNLLLPWGGDIKFPLYSNIWSQTFKIELEIELSAYNKQQLKYVFDAKTSLVNRFLAEWSYLIKCDEIQRFCL